MLLSTHKHPLLRAIMAGAVAMAGASACSRSDRADAGRDTTQTGAVVAPADTQASAATQPATTDTAMAPALDTATRSHTVTTPEPKPSRATAAPAQDTAGQNQQQDVSGYQAMGHDRSVSDSTTSDTAATEVAGAAAVDSTSTAAVVDSMPADHAMADTATAGVPADTSAAGYQPMARDTSAVLAQSDTTTQAPVDTTTQAVADSATILAQVDTAAPTGAGADTLAANGRIRPPEDSTEILGNVAKDSAGVSAGTDTLAVETEPIRPTEDSTETLGRATTDESNSDVEAVGDADAVGAAPVQSTGNIVTGSEAVTLMSRGGQGCRIEDSNNARWDLASSPATLNPCGTGTMTLPKIQTGEKK